MRIWAPAKDTLWACDVGRVMPGFNIPFNNQCHLLDDDISYPNDDITTPAHTEETARNHRYLFESLEPLSIDPGVGSTNLLLFAYKATRPVPEIDEITIHNGQDEIYRPGKNRWKPIEITFYERLTGTESRFASSQDLNDQAARLIYRWWGGTPDGLVGGVVHLDVSSVGAPGGGALDYQKPCQLQMLDGLGNAVWTYYMADCWPVRVTPSDLSYADTEIASITVTLRYNKAIERKSF